LKALAVTRYRRPLEFIDLDEPIIEPNTALIQVLTCSICFSDVKTWHGDMPFSASLPLPHVPGHEICGRVLASNPPGHLEGAMVVVYHLWPCRRCERCRAGDENLCMDPRAWTGFTQHGGLRERMIVPLDRLTVVPEGIDAIHAAPLTCALGTGYRAVVTRGGITGGSRCAVIGLGGVGIHALQVAHAVGAHTIGFDRSQRAVGLAEELRCQAICTSVDQSVPRDFDRHFDLVVDTVGTDQTMETALRLVRPGGRIVAVGYSLTSSFTLASARFVLEEIELVGSRYVGLDELSRAIQLVADGRVQVAIDSVKSFRAANEAFSALAAGTVVGRTVVEVTPDS
jgi:D-arabinose 1-dehydrogenase-like Zn-dependent alcohol dehydrogenase